MSHHIDLISEEKAPTLQALFRERVRRTPERRAYLYFDRDRGEWRESSWSQMAHEVARWQQAMLAEGLQPGDRVALQLHNCREWVAFDQAALGLGLITVPLYNEDHPGNSAYILADAGVKLLLVERSGQWQAIRDCGQVLPSLSRVVVMEGRDDPTGIARRLVDWLPTRGRNGLLTRERNPDSLATIVYTSGTTGRPKGVMLSHHNILFDAHAGLEQVTVYDDDLFLSFLPLSHTLERTIGYYIPMMTGATVAYARSITELAEDLQTIRPTVLISVPRIFERVYGRIGEQLKGKSALARRLFERAVALGWENFEHRQGREPWHARLLLWPLLRLLVASKVLARLGGRLRFAISGGAPLPFPVARLFLGLGLPVVQGYGLTETSPVISVNRLEDNEPHSVGTLLPGIEARSGDQNELLVRGPNVMLGYWGDSEATASVIDDDGWLHTGDRVRLDDRGHLEITGRLKEIIVLANGEKLPPADMEQAITLDPLFDQAMVVGEGRPYLTALVVLNRKALEGVLVELRLDTPPEQSIDDPRLHDALLARIEDALNSFPGYAHIPRIHATLEPWSVDNGLMTPTLKMKRRAISERFADQIDALYRDHASIEQID